MNRPALFLSLLLAAAPVAANAADVRVAIGPKLAEKSDEVGQRDLDRLAAELESDLEAALARSGRDSTFELTITDARPSRPTFEMMARKPGLSMDSVYNGGAAIEGVEISADGARTPISFSWYEDDIRWAQSRTTWTDAEKAFERFARKYGGR